MNATHTVPPRFVDAVDARGYRISWSDVERNRKRIPAPFAQSEATAAIYRELVTQAEKVTGLAGKWACRTRGVTRQDVTDAVAELDGVFRAMLAVHYATVDPFAAPHVVPGAVQRREARKAALSAISRKP